MFLEKRILPSFLLMFSLLGKVTYFIAVVGRQKNSLNENWNNTFSRFQVRNIFSDKKCSSKYIQGDITILCIIFFTPMNFL